MRPTALRWPVRKRRRALTLVELLFASALSVLVAGTIALLFWSMTRANQALYSEYLILQEGDRILRNIEMVLRGASRGQGGVQIYSAGNLSGSTCTARIRVPRSEGITGVAVNFTSEIRFSTSGSEANKLIIDPDVSKTTDALQNLSVKTLAATRLKPYVTNIQFSTPVDANYGNTPTQSLVRVGIRLVAPGTWSAWRGSTAEQQRVIVRTIVLREP